MGKGMAPKKGYNYKKYAENYDLISFKKKVDETKKVVNDTQESNPKDQEQPRQPNQFFD